MKLPMYSTASLLVKRPSHASFHRKSSLKASSVPISSSNRLKKHPLFKLFGGAKKLADAIPHPIRVVTDIDDTVVSSGGVKLFGIALGGIDNLYKRGQFYPGAVQFAFELSIPPIIQRVTNFATYTSLLSKIIPSKVAVLTARAKEFKFALALKSSGKLCQAYQNIGKSIGYEDWGIGTVYYGSVAEWIFQHRKGIRKFNNFEIMMKEDDTKLHLYDAMKNIKQQYIIIGDTGEKDEEAAERIAQTYPDRLKAVFLHHVFDIHHHDHDHHDDHKNKKKKQDEIATTVPSDRTVNGVPIYYFRTYVGAAVKAYQAKLITVQSAQRITDKAVQDLLALDEKIHVQIMHSNGDKSKQETLRSMQAQRWQELLKDVEALPSLRPFVVRHIMSRDSSSSHQQSVINKKIASVSLSLQAPVLQSVLAKAY